jgi:hypothetical protein
MSNYAVLRQQLTGIGDNYALWRVLRTFVAMKDDPMAMPQE